jgi:hypothetical protein
MFLGGPRRTRCPAPFLFSSVSFQLAFPRLVEPLTTRLPQQDANLLQRTQFCTTERLPRPLSLPLLFHVSLTAPVPRIRPRGFSAAPLFTHKNSHAISVITRAPTLQSSRNAPCQINNEQNDSSSHCQRLPLWSGEITHCPPSQALFAECFFLAPAASPLLCSEERSLCSPDGPIP